MGRVIVLLCMLQISFKKYSGYTESIEQVNVAENVKLRQHL